MSTHERELTEPVSLCRSDGRHLDPDALGWSRQPLHTANLRGRWGRTKRWDYWAILTDDLVASITYADVDYLGIVAVWWADLGTGESGGREVVVPLGRGVRLPDRPGDAPLRFSHRNLDVDLHDEAGSTNLRATWVERDGRRGRLTARVERPIAHGSVNVVIPWDARRFQYTSKQPARPTVGELVVGSRRAALGTAAQPAWAVLDVGRGRWPYRTRWNWASGAGHDAHGRVLGLQFGGRWTRGTGFTENGIIVDGEVVKLGEELHWTYDWDAPMRPWRVHADDGRVDLTLTPRHDRHAATRLGLLSTEVQQVFGTWSGTVPVGDSQITTVDGLIGFAEESRSRW